jgi:hypothetical protein
VRVSTALEGYLADRFDRSASGLVRDEVDATLRAEGVPDGIVSRTRDLLDDLLDACDAHRFAPGEQSAESLVADAEKLIDELEEALDV